MELNDSIVEGKLRSYNQDGEAFIYQEWSVSFLNSSSHENQIAREWRLNEKYKKHIKTNQLKELDEFTLHLNGYFVIKDNNLFPSIWSFPKVNFHSYFWYFNC